MTNQKALTHYGVLGMHWGSTKASRRSNKRKIKKDAAEARKSPEHKEGQALFKKPVAEMSNDEIAKLTRRIGLEKQARDVHPNAYKRGMTMVKGVTAAGTSVAALYAVTKTPLGENVIKSPLAKSIAKKVAKLVITKGH